MGIKQKLPLLNSNNRMVRYGGYVVYGFMALIVLGAILPHENTATINTTSTATAAPAPQGTAVPQQQAASTKSSSTSDTLSGWSVKVISSTSWSGSFGGDGNSKTVDGHGNKVISIPGNPWTVVAVVQKQSASGTLKVQILKDGEVKNEGETTASYGVVSVSS
jgi:hypothetical protein